MNHVVLIGHGKMGSALAKGWVKENSKYKISIIEKEKENTIRDGQEIRWMDPQAVREALPENK